MFGVNGFIKDTQWLIELVFAVDESSSKTDEAEKEMKKEGEPEKNGKEPAKTNNEVRAHLDKIKTLKFNPVTSMSKHQVSLCSFCR